MILHKISLSFIIDCNDINNLLYINFLNDSDTFIDGDRNNNNNDDDDDDNDDDEIKGFCNESMLAMDITLLFYYATVVRVKLRFMTSTVSLTVGILSATLY
jgi:hypothetical protein